jgi:hypothetical protein
VFDKELRFKLQISTRSSTYRQSEDWNLLDALGIRIHISIQLLRLAVNSYQQK